MQPRLLTRLRFYLALWVDARLLPMRVGRDRLDRALALAVPAGPARPGLPARHIIRMVRRTTRHPILMRDRRCLRQGLLAFRHLSAAGYQPELHFGVGSRSLETGPVSAHCWIELDGEVVLNPPDPTMVRILVHRRSNPPQEGAAGATIIAA